VAPQGRYPVTVTVCVTSLLVPFNYFVVHHSHSHTAPQGRYTTESQVTLTSHKSHVTVKQRNVSTTLLVPFQLLCSPSLSQPTHNSHSLKQRTAILLQQYLLSITLTAPQGRYTAKSQSHCADQLIFTSQVTSHYSFGSIPVPCSPSLSQPTHIAPQAATQLSHKSLSQVTVKSYSSSGIPPLLSWFHTSTL